MSAHDSHGFTLIELLVSISILGIVTAQLLLVFSGQKQVYITNERLLDVQEDGGLVADLVVSELHMAGYMVPRLAGVSSRDGGAVASDTLCVSDRNALDDTTVRNAGDRFGGARVAAFNLAGARVDLLSAGELNIDGDAAVNDFTPGQGIIVSDGNTTHCAQIVPGGVNTLNGQITIDVPLNPAAFAVASTRAVPAVIYEINGGLGLTRNSLLLSGEVEDLQVEYGVDVDADGVLDLDPNEFPLDTLAGVDSTRIRAVRVTITTRTTQNEPNYTGPGFPGAANRAAGVTDGFRRRRFIASVAPRNLL